MSTIIKLLLTASMLALTNGSSLDTKNIRGSSEKSETQDKTKGVDLEAYLNRYLQEDTDTGDDLDPQQESSNSGATGRRLSCSISYVGIDTVMDHDIRMFTDMNFKACLNKFWSLNKKNGLHADLVKSREQEPFTATRALGEEGSHVGRKLMNGLNSNADIFWGCTGCDEDDVFSDAFRRELNGSEGERDLISDIKKSPQRGVEEAARCLMRRLYKKKNIHVTSTKLDCNSGFGVVEVESGFNV
mmetsp:Transcript_34571/g.53058  ORF Transcript_34571/g.53058 Transcript_34571/m.53058 type:complete len:244 (+) Transcript_34571:77-808(+)